MIYAYTILLLCYNLYFYIFIFYLCVVCFFLYIVFYPRSARFHDVSEFDEAKRSCRRRLAGHNERRRKTSYDSHGDG